jgi:hypothetical protein
MECVVETTTGNVLQFIRGLPATALALTLHSRRVTSVDDGLFSFQCPFGRAWRRAQSGSFVSARPNSRSRPAMSAL